MEASRVFTYQIAIVQCHDMIEERLLLSVFEGRKSVIIVVGRETFHVYISDKSIV